MLALDDRACSFHYVHFEYQHPDLTCCLVAENRFRNSYTSSKSLAEGRHRVKKYFGIVAFDQTLCFFIAYMSIHDISSSEMKVYNRNAQPDNYDLMESLILNKDLYHFLGNIKTSSSTAEGRTILRFWRLLYCHAENGYTKWYDLISLLHHCSPVNTALVINKPASSDILFKFSRNPEE